MPSSDLDAALRQRAEKSAEAIMRAAKADADRIAADADRTIEERRTAVLGGHEQEYRTYARANVAAERHEAMRAVLVAKTRVVERVLQRARALVADAIGSDAYRATLAEEVERALLFVGAEETVVRCPEALAPALRDALRANPSVTVQVEEDAGSGFVMIGKAGRVRVDATLETRLDRLAPTLAIEIHKRLEER
ncbi:MAG: V-type ATP synthase subunit E family protein [Polyangiales bacterium]